MMEPLIINLKKIYSSRHNRKYDKLNQTLLYPVTYGVRTFSPLPEFAILLILNVGNTRLVAQYVRY